MAVAYATLTAAADPQAVCTAVEAEANISECIAPGTVGEEAVVLVAGEVLSYPEKVVFRITGTAEGDITAAIAAVGGLEIASGYEAIDDITG